MIKAYIKIYINIPLPLKAVLDRIDENSVTGTEILRGFQYFWNCEPINFNPDRDLVITSMDELSKYKELQYFQKGDMIWKAV